MILKRSQIFEHVVGFRSWISSLTYVQRYDVWMVFSTHDKGEVPGSIQQLQGGGVAASSEAVQSQVSLRQRIHRSDETGWINQDISCWRINRTHIVMYGLWMVYSSQALSAHYSLLLVGQSLREMEGFRTRIHRFTYLALTSDEKPPTVDPWLDTGLIPHLFL